MASRTLTVVEEATTENPTIVEQKVNVEAAVKVHEATVEQCTSYQSTTGCSKNLHTLLKEQISFTLPLKFFVFKF